MKEISVLGIDLAKNVFQLHGVDQKGRTVLKKAVKREKFLEFVTNMPPCLIGMEACGGAHFWAREFRSLGHTPKLMAPQFVKPYVKSNKNDAADAEAVNEAVTRSNMRFVPIKESWQQDIQSLHRVRQRLVRSRTAITNELHGLLLEYGVVVSKASSKLFKELAFLLAPENSRLSSDAKEIFQMLIEEYGQSQDKINRCDEKIKTIARNNALCKRLQTIPGVGVVSATAILAAVSDPKLFKNGRQFAAWLGLVPRQASSGGKEVLLGISKRGDAYIRSLLVHGARSVLLAAKRKTDRMSLWALKKESARGKNRAIVAIANKNARIIWALLSHGQDYRVA